MALSVHPLGEELRTSQNLIPPEGDFFMSDISNPSRLCGTPRWSWTHHFHDVLAGALSERSKT
jgi:hypothetical protein